MIDLPGVFVVRMATKITQYVICGDFPPPNDRNTHGKQNNSAKVPRNKAKSLVSGRT